MTKLSGVKRYMIIGAVAGALFYIGLSAFLYPFGGPAQCDFICFPYWALPTIYVMAILSVLMRFVAPNLGVNLYVALIGAVLFYALIGSVVGLVVAKIRKIK